MEHSETEPLKSAQPKVVLFTQPDCPPCHVVKEFLSERGIVFEERDVTRDPSAAQDLLEKHKSHSTPTLLIADEVMIGFDPDRLDQLLEK